MRIVTHVLWWVDGCPRWIWRWLTPEQWGALRHVAKGAIIGGCLTVPPAGVLLTPSPTVDMNPRAKRAGIVPGEVAGFAPIAEGGILPRRVLSREGTVPTPEPAGAWLLLPWLAGLALVRRRKA